jgi:3-oxo-5-alpha-steroid 4-dehydrogenase 1
MHIAVVPITSVFNAANGFAMATYLTSPPARAYLASAFSHPVFYVGLIMWAAGFVGNIVHDEVLLKIRRKANVNHGKADEKQGGQDKAYTHSEEYYGIPHGMLYEYISFPNYLCELFEWLGFALAAAPLPSPSLAIKTLHLGSQSSFLSLLLATVPPTFSHPYIFLIATLLPMVPRAYRGHRWYHRRFPEYPKQRKAILPFVL